MPNTSRRIATLVIILGALASSGARAESISLMSGTFTTNPGQIAYTYVSPMISTFASLQIGRNVNVNVNQNSQNNISSVAQVGGRVKATVVQSGQLNTSNIQQVGRNTSALVIQFGN